MKMRFCKALGCIMAGVGLLIILALILPTIFWWFFLGGVLILTGIGMFCHF